jgi:hypothetical protein
MSAALVALAVVPVIGKAVTWNAGVGTVQSTYDGADCFYFTLNGVTEADPVKSGDPIFAIPRTQYGAKDAYAMLLAAKLADKQLIVVTRGTLLCGYAAVAEIKMP